MCLSPDIDADFMNLIARYKNDFLSNIQLNMRFGVVPVSRLMHNFFENFL
jgi:hypothetical protein